MNALNRFLDIIHANTHKEEVLAFLGLGSMHDQSRLDTYSDVDFFLIVKDGFVKKFLTHLDWLQVSTIIFSYQETEDGLKVIYEDGILLEFAVFEVAKLKDIPYQRGTVFYHKEGFDVNVLEPTKSYQPKPIDLDYIIPDLLSNLYVGLLRELRGEHVAALLMIQVYAAHKTLRVLSPHDDDPFVVERRIEQRLSISYDTLYPGINYNIQSIMYQLELLHDVITPYTQLVDKIKNMIKDNTI